jgi:hypothetical protein
VAVIALAGLAVGVSPAAARELPVQMAVTGSAVTSGCPGGAPCTERVTYDGQTSNTPTPFSAFTYFRQPVRVTGYLDFPIASSGDCVPESVSGVLQVLAARGGGSRERVAFEVVVNNATAACAPGHHSMSAAVQFDSANTEDPAFRGAVGSGVMQLQDAPGAFSADVNGVIDVRH